MKTTLVILSVLVVSLKPSLGKSNLLYLAKKSKRTEKQMKTLCVNGRRQFHLRSFYFYFLLFVFIFDSLKAMKCCNGSVVQQRLRFSRIYVAQGFLVSAKFT